MKKFIILALMAFSTLATAQEEKSYKISQVPTEKGGTWGAIPGENGQLIFTDNAANVSKGDDFKSRLFLLDRNNKETALPNFSKYERIGSPYISATGKEFFFTVSGTVAAKTSGGGIFSPGTKIYPLQIMIAKKGANGEWGAEEAFEHNSNQFSNGDPALSPDGNYLYFTSDRSGGQGGTDIWRSKRTGNGWGEPENAGSVINTGGDERFPRFDPRGNLYFSSTTGSATGGLELYKCAASGSGFAKPVRMNYPFNAEGDDFAISFLTDDSGYLSSNRTGSDRIYFFEPMKAVVVRDTVKIIETKKEEGPTAQDAFKKLKPIYFDYNKHNLRYATELPALLDLVLFMRQYPNAVINLPSHADCRGSAQYNSKLSQKRGEAVKEYLVKTAGVEPHRVIVHGFGSTVPANECDCSKSKRCTEAQFQENRRVEYELVRY
jgi:outer membrane protein OmpA-like peptidoglycan-associated protein